MITKEWSDWRDGLWWWIQSVYVIKAQRRRGAFRTLYEHVCELAQSEDDVCGIRLYVEKDNSAAQSVYRDMGMLETHYRLYEATL
jgi:ribosomal protein S18 acetylase RimI-like enzyme